MSDLQWKKVEVLGAGSYGTVSLAILVDEQNRFHSFIAVKSSIPRLAFSLEKEEQIFKSLWEGESGGCQEIIECFGTEITVEHGHQFYNLFLEYAPYGSLADLIHKKPLPETEVSVYARMIVKGLSHIHRKGIVHCDLKPENILVFPSLDKEIANYQLKIADFGLSKTKEEKADVELWKSKPRGTPSYLSPEAFSGHIDAPMDIWALGCIVIEMLTGLPAWGESPLLIEELRYLVEHHELSPRKPQGIGFFCHDFLEKCFTKDPSKRWTADRVLDHPFLYITQFHSYYLATWL
ncbi:mitogen-activated protein kinase kinase kinase 20-like [Arachis hypogaea]|uniref:mitogen-activated protein kinase kinase kinase 20-like n=1 Tax=Arachis hypogaea TaxID=3818 RepID=UPI0034E7CA8E